MWRNYLILMVRKYRSWQGLALANLVALVVAYSLMAPLFAHTWFNPGTFSLLTLLLALLVVAIIYSNFIALQLKQRRQEAYIRKLLGAGNRQLAIQLLLESVVLTTFMVIAGIVVAGLLYPLCSRVWSWQGYDIVVSLYLQLSYTALLVILIGLIAALIPVFSFIRQVNKDLVQLANRW